MIIDVSQNVLLVLMVIPTPDYVNLVILHVLLVKVLMPTYVQVVNSVDSLVEILVVTHAQAINSEIHKL